MYKAHEVLGTDLPIFREKEGNHFFFEEILHFNENPGDYSISGYIPIKKHGEIFYKALYLSNLKCYNKSNLNKEKRNKGAKIIRFPQKNI